MFPLAGDVISGASGIRKLRWSAKGHGKRGGMRLIYYYFIRQSQIYMLLAYPKNTKDDLAQQEKKYLKKLIEDFENG
jgi:hypothetical protein